MAISLNLCPNGKMVAPGGYPFTLSVQGETFANGVVPKGAISASVTVRSVLGTTPSGANSTVDNANYGAPNVYLALFAAPTSSGGADGAEVANTRQSVTGLSNVAQTLTTVVPVSSSTVPAVYIMRLWVDGLTGTNGVSVSDVTVN